MPYWKHRHMIYIQFADILYYPVYVVLRVDQLFMWSISLLEIAFVINFVSGKNAL